jgi:site-specific DNA-cytosine methylase
LPPGSLASGLSDSNPSSRQVAQIDASYVLDWLRQSERLQGLPDGWTQLGGTPDSRRYSALGDAVTATVAEWIGRRLMEAECA